MKLSTLGLGFAVAASSLVGIASVAPSAKAASVYADNVSGGIDFTGEWEFSFVSSYGSYMSDFGFVKDGVYTTFFSETDGSVPGSIAGASTLTFTFDFGTGNPDNRTTGFFLKTLNPALPTIVSSFTNQTGFYIATTEVTAGDIPGFKSADQPSEAKAFLDATGTYTPQGYRVIGVNDLFSGDKDYNDFIVKARPVPVPAIIPGIALAGAFFGSKALKRKQEKAAKSVA